MKERKLNSSIFFILICAVSFHLHPLFAQTADDLYRKGKFKEAEKAYQKLDLENPKDIRYRYNKGCAAFKNSNYKTAAAAFSSVLRRTKDKDLQFKAVFNLGNIAFSQKDFSSASELYKKAVLLKPENYDAKYNWELSLKKLKESKSKKKDKKNDKEQEKGDKKKNDNKVAQNDKQKNNPAKKSKNEKMKKDPKKNNSSKNNKNEPDKKDLSGKLEGENKITPSLSKEEREKMAALQYDKRKAKALLDNIKENRAKFFEFQFKGKEKKPSKSGRYW